MVSGAAPAGGPARYTRFSRMATYAIGDVQGCFRTLERLLRRLAVRDDDRLWLAGDLVNRGPRSLEVLRWAKQQGERATVVLGNHDLHLLGVAAGWRRHKPSDTLVRVLEAPDREPLLAWLRQRPLVHRGGRFLLVHAGLLPAWTADQAEALAREAEAALQGEEAERVFEELRDDPPAWRDDLKRRARVRLALYAFTRMRVVGKDGQPRDGFAGPPEKAPKGTQPWFDATGRKSANVTVVCGHWAAAGLRVRPDRIALDSGCVWGRALSAVRLEDGTIYQEPFCD